jgi:hypothetical protein
MGERATLILETLAQATWERLHHAREYGVSQGEETITDINLLDIKRFGDGRIKVRKCPKHLESETGVDWDMLIGSTNTGWSRYAVQAKRVNIKASSSNRYDTLKKIVKTKEDGDVVDKEEQLSILRRFASRRNASPLYCLYNYADKDDYDKYWQCCHQSQEIKQLGCTVTPASVVDWATSNHGKRTFEDIHQKSNTLPWRCLSECPFIAYPKLRYSILKKYPQLERRLEFAYPFSENENETENVPDDFWHLFNEEVRYKFEDSYEGTEVYPRWSIMIEVGDDLYYEE